MNPDPWPLILPHAQPPSSAAPKPPDQAKIGDILKQINREAWQDRSCLRTPGHMLSWTFTRQRVSQDISWLLLKGVGRSRFPKKQEHPVFSHVTLANRAWGFSKHLCYRYLCLFLLLSCYQSLLWRLLEGNKQFSEGHLHIPTACKCLEIKNQWRVSVMQIKGILFENSTLMWYLSFVFWNHLH